VSMDERPPFPPAWAVGEFSGTFLLVFFGCGSVAAAVLTGAEVGVFQGALVWGLGIATAIYLTGSLSGAHLNPAITLTFAAVDRLPWRRVPGYVLMQFLGAFAASAVLYGAFAGALGVFEASHHIVRGAPGSEASAMIFGEFFPNPAGLALDMARPPIITEARAFFVEALGTAVLALVVLCVTDERNTTRPGVFAAPTIGLTITLLISLLAPLTMAGFNPARDLAPRLFSALAGWGPWVFRANASGWWTVYVCAPLIGGPAGGLLYRLFFRRCYRATQTA
jgi:glycerol uptake facilitator protein